MLKKQMNILAAACKFLAAAAVTAGMLCSRAEGMEDTGRLLDAVLVIDCSGSLDLPVTGTDPEKLALEAAGLFSDMAQAEKTRIGIVAFSDKIEMEIPLTPLSSEKDRMDIRDAIRSLDFDYTGDTDLGKAALTAAEMFDRGAAGPGTEDQGTQDSGNQRARAILFFTDGWIDLPKAADPEEAEKASRKELSEALRKSRNEDIRVYTVMLGEGGASFDQAFEESRIFHIARASELPSVYLDIFAELIGARPVSDGIEDIEIREPGTVSGTDITIPPAPEGSIEEANVILISQKPLAQISMYDPDGTRLDPQIFMSAHYSLVKLIKPSGGTYHLDVLGGEPCTVNVNLLLNSSVILRCAVSDSRDEGKAQIRAWLEHGGEQITDPQICGNFRVTAVLKDPETGNETDHELALRFVDGCFTADTPVPPGKRIQVRVHAQSENTERWAEAEEYRNDRYPDIICREPKDEIVLKGLFPGKAYCEILLNDYYQAWDGSSLSWEVEADSDSIAFREENDTLFVTGRSRGSVCLSVTAADRYGNHSTQVFSVSVQTVFPSARAAVLAAFAAGSFIIGTAIGLTALIRLIMRNGTTRQHGCIVYSFRAEGLFLGGEQSRCDLAGMEKRREDLSRMAVPGKGRGGLRVPAREVFLCRGINAYTVRCRNRSCRLLTAGGTETEKVKLDGKTRFQVRWEENGRRTEMICLYIPGDSAECTKE